MLRVQRQFSWFQEVSLSKWYSTFSKASSAFYSLSHILWCQRKIQTSTKDRILNSVIPPTLLYGLDSTVLLEAHVHHLESFVIHCLQIILCVSVREKKRHTTMAIPPCAKWQSSREYHGSSHSIILVFSGTFQGCPKTGYLGSFSCVSLLVTSILLEDRNDGGMMLWPVTLINATCLELGESMPKSMALGAPPSDAL